MECLIKASTIYENMYPLTEKIPAGLLTVGKRPVVDWLLEDLEGSGRIQEYLVEVCPEYKAGVEAWRKQHPLKEKIRIITQEEAAGFSGGPELPAELITDFSIGDLLKEEKDIQSYLKEEKILLLNSLPAYEDCEHRRMMPKNGGRFQIEAFTQERYGEVFISRIEMMKSVFSGETAVAKLRIHNAGTEALLPENTRLRYRLWKEQAYEDRFDVDKILMPDEGLMPLPGSIQPKEAEDFTVEVAVPINIGKYYIKFDIEKDGVFLPQGEGSLLFPSVSFITEYYYDVPFADLQAMPKVILAGTPESANAGEHLEAAAVREFMQASFPEHKIMEFTARNLEKFWRQGGSFYHEKDIIVPYGSGFMGLPEKMGEEHLRRRTASLASLPEAHLRFISMPQHMGFSVTEEGKEEIAQSAAAYGGDNYYLTGADEADYQFLKEHFEKSVIGKAPLLCFGKKAVKDCEPEGDDFTVVVCGGGREGFQDTAYKVIDENQYHRMFLNLDYNAYRPGAWFGERTREILIDFCCKTIQNTRAVVTDTYFGLAYALMCNRPCVVYGESCNQEWFADRDDVIFVEKLEDLEKACKEILEKKGKGPLKEEYYLPLKRQLAAMHGWKKKQEAL